LGKSARIAEKALIRKTTEFESRNKEGISKIHINKPLVTSKVVLHTGLHVLEGIEFVQQIDDHDNQSINLFGRNACSGHTKRESRVTKARKEHAKATHTLALIGQLNHLTREHHNDVFNVHLQFLHFLDLWCNDLKCALILNLFGLLGCITFDLRNGGRTAAKRVQIGQVLVALLQNRFLPKTNKHKPSTIDGN
jgi:hypothetical protein